MLLENAVIQSLNFRRPLNHCFFVIGLILMAIGLLILSLQWVDIRTSIQQQNLHYVRNLAAYTEEYLNDYETTLGNIITQMDDFNGDKMTIDPRGPLRHWLFEHLNSTPDAQSIIYADCQGDFIRLPSVAQPTGIKQKLDPRNTVWYSSAVNDDLNSVHYTSSKDVFDHDNKTLTLSQSLVNHNDGKKLGVLAIRLNTGASEYILKTAQPPLSGQTWIIDAEGQHVANERGYIDPQLLKTVAARIHQGRHFFYLPENGHWYYYDDIGQTGWFMVYEVSRHEIDAQTFTHSANVLYSLIFALIALLAFWWIVRGILNTLYLRIATSIRNGTLEQKAAEQLLIEEIHSSSVQQEMIKSEALTDKLTGLKNRRALDDDIEMLQHANDLVVALIDIDNFKLINDTYGHAIGDMVLNTVSDMGLRLRGLDNITLYRYGGEEIAILFQGMSIEDAMGYLNRWRESCDKRQFREQNLHVTFSGGLCLKGKRRVQEALEYADKLLYIAKRSGKNRIISKEN